MSFGGAKAQLKAALQTVTWTIPASASGITAPTLLTAFGRVDSQQFAGEDAAVPAAQFPYCRISIPELDEKRVSDGGDAISQKRQLFPAHLFIYMAGLNKDWQGLADYFDAVVDATMGYFRRNSSPQPGIVLPGHYPTIVLLNRPIAYWRLGESQGFAEDLSGYGDPGTVVGGVVYGVPGALFGDTDTAMTFNGSTGYIQAPYAAAFDLANFSVECWFKIPSAGANAGLFCKTVGGAVNTQYQFFIEAGNLKLRIFSGVTQYTIGTATPSLGVWHHAVGTYDPAGTGTMRVYLDGIQTDVSGAPVPTPNTGNGVSFLGALNASTYLLPGSLDEVAIYPTTLTPAQVSQHYNAGVSTFAEPLNDHIVGWGLHQRARVELPIQIAAELEFRATLAVDLHMRIV